MTNLGTTEHVANQMQAMKVIHDLCRVGGVMTHTLPMGGYEVHGLVNYNPKFFWALARSNEYKWLDFRLGFEPEHNISQDIIFEATRWNSPAFIEELSKQTLRNSWLEVTMVKVRDMPYVPPIDAQPGTGSSATARLRYPTVFRA